MILKKAAMFGLDARIALAIFGALSVISGAALYSAIEQSKTTAMVATFSEIGKAIEQYYLDVGTIPLDIDTSGTWIVKTSELGELLQSSKTNWNGPYLPLSYSALATLDIDDYSLNLTLHGNRTGSTLSSSMACSSAYNTCDVYLQRDIHASVISEGVRIFNALDNLVDGGDGHNAGIVHAVQASNSTHVLDSTGEGMSIFYKIMPCGYGICY